MPEFTPRDVIVFTFRDRFQGYWVEADDYADALLAELASYGYEINEKPELDNSRC